MVGLRTRPPGSSVGAPAVHPGHFWQATRDCVGCTGGVEFGPVRSFVVEPAKIERTTGS